MVDVPRSSRWCPSLEEVPDARLALEEARETLLMPETFDILEEGRAEGVDGRDSWLYLRAAEGVPGSLAIEEAKPAGIGGTLGMSGVWLRMLDAGRRSDDAGVGVPGPPNDFRIAAPGVAADGSAAVAPPTLGRDVRTGFGVTPEVSPELLAVLAASFVGLDEPARAGADFSPSRMALRSFAVRFR